MEHNVLEAIVISTSDTSWYTVVVDLLQIFITVGALLFSLWCSPALFQKTAIKITKARISVYEKDNLCAVVEIKNKRQYPIYINQIVFMLGDNNVLIFGRDNNYVIQAAEKRTVKFDRVQTCGDACRKGKGFRTTVDTTKITEVKVFVLTHMSDYEYILSLDEVKESIKAIQRGKK